MKRIIVYLSSIFLLCLTSCEDMTTVFNPNSDAEYKKKQFSTLAGQFDYIWTGLNNSYMFWYSDSTDWDAVRDKYLPKFRELDEMWQRGDSVNDAIIYLYITDIASTLRDRHLEIHMTNPYSSLPRSITTISGLLSSLSSDLGILLRIGNRFYKDNLFNNYPVSNIKEMEYNDGIHKYAYSCVINDSIPFIHVPNFYTTDSIFCKNNPGYSHVVNNFFDNIRLLSSQNRIKGIIIDNRFNFGGQLADLESFIQTFSSMQTEVYRQRSKTGLGKFDYSPWIPFIINPDPTKYVDIHNAPIIILQDHYSMSAGELLGHALSFLPHTHLIGRPTYGAHSILANGLFEYFHTGSFNTDSINYYIENYSAAAGVQTATVCIELRNKVTGKYEQLESIGITPDENIKLDQDRFFSITGDNQLDAAIKYINNNN